MKINHLKNFKNLRKQKWFEKEPMNVREKHSSKNGFESNPQKGVDWALEMKHERKEEK